MTTSSTHLVHVYFHGRGKAEPIGRLLFKNRAILFEYDPSFLKTGLQLSPYKLPLKPGISTCDDRTFEGLFGLFNDSLPDGWGRLLLDRKLMNAGVNTDALTILDRLCFVGSNGMGALSYLPEKQETSSPSNRDLDEIAKEVADFEELDNDRYVDDLLALGGSSAGARPKILTQVDGADWLIKFRSSLDPKDISNIEFAYHLMALEAGIDMPEARLFPSRTGKIGYYGVKRFDRSSGKKIHMHTISGLLHADHRLPSLDYETVLKATLWLTRDIRQCEKQLRIALFNILSHNRDDHAKNFSFLMNEDGIWTVSPAYDLTYSNGPNGEHCTMIMGEGKKPTLQHFLRLAAIVDIKPNEALQIFKEVSTSISKWKQHASAADVGQQSTKLVQETLKRTKSLFDN